MALSGSLNSSKYNGRYIRFEWNATQNITTNKSTITWALKGAGNSSESGVSWYMAGGFRVNVNGTYLYNKSTDYRIQLSNGTLIAQGTFELQHDSNGLCSMNVEIDAGIYTFARNVSGSTNFTLDTINRESTFSMNNFVYVIGDNVTFTINRQSTSFVHTLEYGANGQWFTIATNVGATHTWIVPSSIASFMPNGDSLAFTFRCITYYNGSAIGSKTSEVVLGIPSTYVPQITKFNIDEANEKITSSGFNVFLHQLSKLSIYAEASATHSASISGMEVYLDNKLIESSKRASISISQNNLNHGTHTIKIIAIDSRNRKTETSRTIEIAYYHKPSVVTCNAIRCNSDGSLNENGTNISVSFTTNVPQLDNNPSTVEIVSNCNGAKKSYYPTFTTGNYIITDYCSPTTAFTITITVSDKLYSDTRTLNVLTSHQLLHFHKSGRGLGIGKYCENQNWLEVGYSTTFDNFVRFENNVTFSNAPYFAFHPVRVENFNSKFTEIRKIVCYRLGHFAQIGGMISCDNYTGGTIKICELNYEYLVSSGSATGGISVGHAEFICACDVGYACIKIDSYNYALQLKWVKRYNGSDYTGYIEWISINATVLAGY